MLNIKSTQAPAMSALSVLDEINNTSSSTADINSSSSAAKPRFTLVERRRPDRLRIENPHLIPLLRDRATSSGADCVGDFDKRLDIARGTIFGFILSIPLWALIALLVYGLIHAVGALLPRL